MTTKLREIATIHTGVFAKPATSGEIVYIQAKHFDQNGKLISTLRADLNKNDISEKHLLRHGDVLFAAKGTKNFATWYENKNQSAVASTSFFVIRLNGKFLSKILPEFLVWCLNNQISQKYLKSKAIGTSIVSISKSVLEDLEISIPDLSIQQTILKITNLRSIEKTINQKLEILKEIQIQSKILKAINYGDSQNDTNQDSNYK